MFINETLEANDASSVFSMAVEEFFDFVDDGGGVVDVAAQLFHGAPTGAGAVDDVVHQLAVFGFYAMGLQQGQCGLAHHVGMDVAHATHGHAGCRGLAHGLVGNEGIAENLGTLSHQGQQVFHSALGIAVQGAIGTFHNQGQALVMQIINQLFHAAKIV